MNLNKQITKCIWQVFSQLLQAPLDDANALIKERFPVPRMVICDQHTSQVETCVCALAHKTHLLYISPLFQWTNKL